MQREDFEQLKNFILDKNEYFSYGFANAYKDETSNSIWVDKDSDKLKLLSADNLGNYFYLKAEPSAKYIPKEKERLSDVGTQRLSFLDQHTIHLIAIVSKADSYLLIENLRNTFMMFEPFSVVCISSIAHREDIIISELQGLESRDIQATLQRLCTETIVKMTLEVSKVFVPSNCIVNPIKN